MTRGEEGGAAPRARLTGLDGLRGIAALLVLGYHLWAEFGAFPIFSRAYLAVDFFFMLSGFVMARTYEGRLRSGSFTPTSFLKLRYRRLWAPLAVGTVIGAAVQIAAGTLSPLRLGLGVLLLPILTELRPYPLNRPAWSIFFELLANAGHAAFLARLSNSRLAFVLLGFTTLLVAFALPYGAITLGLRSADFFTGIPRVFVPYVIGILLCRLPLQGLARPEIAVVGLLASLLLIPAGLAWDLAFVLVACPVIIVLGANEFGGRLAAFAGAVSFPLYAIHFPIIEVCKALHLGPVVAGGASVFAAVVGSVVLEKLRRAPRSEAIPAELLTPGP